MLWDWWCGEGCCVSTLNNTIGSDELEMLDAWRPAGGDGARLEVMETGTPKALHNEARGRAAHPG